ncbi:MAG: hypothetical protein K9J13_03795 [Saprospiraceae bacterium]|nr:hypothetical protein [Saprospiraceae bacterium]
MKKIILTIDYELFFGAESGSVQDCLIEPTKRLLEILRKNDSTMTVYWDIMHFIKLEEIKQKHRELEKDYNLIENQIYQIINSGHEIGLHFHPHWHLSEFMNGTWYYDYRYFEVKDFINNKELFDELLQKCIDKVNGLISFKQHKLNSYRAGAYAIEPFTIINNLLKVNEIYVDSSVCPNMYSNRGICYDFRDYPNKLMYKFDKSPKYENENGKFWELPIKTVRIPFFLNLYCKLLRKTKYKNLFQAKGVGKSNMSKKKLYEIVMNNIVKYRQLTTDNAIPEEYLYLLKKSENYSVQILHPKYLNDTILNVLDDLVTGNKIKFISIKDYLNGG